MKIIPTAKIQEKKAREKKTDGKREERETERKATRYLQNNDVDTM